MSRLAYALSALALVALAAALYSQGGLSPSILGATPTTPITSAGSPTDPVPFIWSTHVSHREDGHRLYLQGGNLHAIADEVRVLRPDGTVLASATATPLGEGSFALCGVPGTVGMVRADVPLSRAELERFRGSSWPSGYRVEARVGGIWRTTQLTFAGCLSIE